MIDRFKFVVGSVLGVTLLALSSCSSTVDEVTNTIDCHSVCQRYADCFNADYDVDGCTDKCQNSADSSSARQSRLQTCSSCIDDRSCTSATFSCTDDCAGIVP
jgi:hypothetical protein